MKPVTVVLRNAGETKGIRSVAVMYCRSPELKQRGKPDSEKETVECQGSRERSRTTAAGLVLFSSLWSKDNCFAAGGPKGVGRFGEGIDPSVSKPNKGRFCIELLNIAIVIDQSLSLFLSPSECRVKARW